MLDKLIDLILQFLKLFQFWTVVPPYQAGVRVRLGKFHAVLMPGFHWMAPFRIDERLSDNVVIETMRVKPQTLTTKDGVPVVISSVVTFSIIDIKTFLLEVEGRNNVVEDSSYGATSDFIMKHTWAELSDLDNLSNELTKTVRRQAKQYGVNIRNVQIADFAKCPSLRLISSESTKHV